MSEQWLGLHNQDDHEWGWGERDAWCTTCEGPRRDRGQCLAKEPCRCCLAAEVEVLREQITCDGVRCAKCEQAMWRTFAATITTGAVVWCIDRLWRGPKP